MKKITLLILVLTPILVKSQSLQKKKFEKANLHATIDPAGGDIIGTEGSVSYSIGQVFYDTNNNQDYNISEGVQQPLVITIEPLGSTKKEPKFKVAAFPNPVTNYFTIEASDYSERSLSYHLMDLNGRLIKEDEISSKGTQVNVSNLPVAIYLLMISDHGNRIKTIKIIKN